MFDTPPSFIALPVSAPPPSALASLLCGPVKTIAAGQEIYAQGDKAQALYQVVFGVVRVFRLLADGRRQICAFHTGGEIFGFEVGAERHFFADAVTATGLRCLRTDSGDDLSHTLLSLALSSLDKAHDHLLTVGRNDARGRVAAFLLEMAERQNEGSSSVIDIPMSRADIADYLGLTIETVSRIITRLKQSKIIRLVSSRKIQILNWSALGGLTA